MKSLVLYHENFNLKGDNMDNILCKKCNQVLTKDDFYFRNGKILRPCKNCKKAYYVSWVEKNPQYHQVWREKSKKKDDVVQVS